MAKQYVGKGWRKDFDNGGYVINLSVKLEEVSKLITDKYGNVRLTVGAMKEPEEKSKATHYVAVDEYRNKKDEPF